MVCLLKTFSVPTPQRNWAIQHLFEQVSLKRELHIAGMLLRRGIEMAAFRGECGGAPYSGSPCPYGRQDEDLKSAA
jgi:hypothetical protein